MGRNGLTQTTTGDLEEDEQEEEEEEDGLLHGRRKRKVAFMPSLGKHHLNARANLIDLYRRYHAHHLLPWPLAKSELSAHRMHLRRYVLTQTLNR